MAGMLASAQAPRFGSTAARPCVGGIAARSAGSHSPRNFDLRSHRTDRGTERKDARWLHIRKYRKRGGLALGTTLVVAVVAGDARRDWFGGQSCRFQFRLLRSTGAVTAGCLPPRRRQGHGHLARHVRGHAGEGARTAGEEGLRPVRDPGAERAVRAVLVSGRHRDGCDGAGKRQVHRSLQHRDVHRRSGHRSGTGCVPQRVPGRQHATRRPGPVHKYHVGLWFNSPKTAAKAGCGSTVTPFNGTHNAGGADTEHPPVHRSARPASPTPVNAVPEPGGATPPGSGNASSPRRY